MKSLQFHFIISTLKIKRQKGLLKMIPYTADIVNF